MSVFLKSKLSGRTTGNLALACSLVLHAGFFALYSSWQWELDSPTKNQAKVVKIKFLPTPTNQQPSTKPAPMKTTHFSPAQPVATTSTPAPSLHPRTPKLSPRTPKLSPRNHLPVSWTKRTIRTQNKRFKPRRIQQTSMPISRPTSVAQPLNVGRPKITLKAMIRSNSTHNTHYIESVQATTPVQVRAKGRIKNLQRKTPSLPTTSPNTQTYTTRTALAVETPTHQLNDIRPRSIPTLSQATASIETFPAAQQLIKTSMSSAESRATFAALPRELTRNPSDSRNSSGTDLNALRGLFTGKVRQRIANAKHYPRTARRRGMEGQPVIAFSLNRQGRLMKVNLAQTSGYQLLDQAALEAVQQAAPYPEIPAELKTNTYQFKLPIYFVLK